MCNDAQSRLSDIINSSQTVPRRSLCGGIQRLLYLSFFTGTGKECEREKRERRKREKEVSCGEQSRERYMNSIRQASK